MCSRKDNLTSEFVTAEVASVMLLELWPVLMTRHGGCNPSEACVIDACLRSSQARVGEAGMDKLNERIRAGIKQARAGTTIDHGDFSHYLEEE